MPETPLDTRRHDPEPSCSRSTSNVQLLAQLTELVVSRIAASPDASTSVTSGAGTRAQVCPPFVVCKRAGPNNHPIFGVPNRTPETQRCVAHVAAASCCAAVSSSSGVRTDAHVRPPSVVSRSAMQTVARHCRRTSAQP